MRPRRIGTHALALLLGLALSLALRPGAARAADPAAVESARSAQDRHINTTLAQGGEAALERLAGAAVMRAERTGTAIDLYLAGRILVHPRGPKPDRARQTQSFRLLQRAIQADPTLWRAKMGMAQLWMEFGQFDDAQRAVDQIRAQVPREEEPLRLAIQLQLRARQWAEAVPLLERLHAGHPDEPDLIAALAEANFMAERYEDAFGWFVRLRASPVWTANPRWPAMYAQAALVAGQPDVARRELEGLRGTAVWDETPQMQAQLLQVLLQQRADAPALRREVESYLPRVPDDHGVRSLAVDLAIEAGDLPGARAHLETLLPHIPEGEARTRAEGLLAMLREGFDPRRPVPRPAGPAPPPVIPEDSPYVDLLRRCTSNDVATRRLALQEYLEIGLEVLDPIIYLRVHEAYEPDATCRILVARILGGFDARSTTDPATPRSAARHLALALEDGDAAVRTVVAEELGGLGVPAALLYLFPLLYAIDVRSEPSDAATGRLREREFNAVRLALVELGGWDDGGSGGSRWVPLADAQAVRDRWTAWTDGPGGQAMTLRALADLREAAALEDGPYGPLLWCQRYIFAHCFSPTPTPVALAAYRVFRSLVPATPPDPGAGGTVRGASLFHDFPVLSDAELETLPREALDARLGAWWRSHVGVSATRIPDDGR
jgi:thioredoxin-like negative regulator of GroEL